MRVRLGIVVGFKLCARTNQSV